MKILIIDDIEDSVKGIIDACEENDWEHKLTGFDGAYSNVFQFDPDVIVLDWREDAENVDIGETILDNIWRNGFRPLIIFSANAKLIDIGSKLQESNMVKITPKGDEEPVVKTLQHLEKFVSSLKSYRSDMGKALIISLNSIENIKEQPDLEENVVSYVLSKRTSAYFDKEYIGSLPPAWVQYLCPPVNESLCVCDIIRVKTDETSWTSAGNPEEYMIVLTPSCDMVCDNGRSPKVSHVLCAHCYGKQAFHGMTLAAEPTDKNIKRVVEELNLGYNNSKVALPGLMNEIPYLTVDLKKIELIAINQIAINKNMISDDIRYVRVASVCSPFREQIVWAHMQNSCRPGVPDRNMELWAKEMLKI